MTERERERDREREREREKERDRQRQTTDVPCDRVGVLRKEGLGPLECCRVSIFLVIFI